MFRWFLCLLLLQLATARRSWCDRHPSSCRHSSHRHNDCHRTLRDNHKQFYDLSKDLIKIDKKLQRSCDSASNHSIEFISSDGYMLNVRLPDFELEHISVQLRHRLLHIQAYKPGENSKLFSEFKIVPTFLELTHAAYKFADGVLEVIIPIKDLKDQSEAECKRHFDESVHIVQNLNTKEKNRIEYTTTTPLVETSY